MRRLLGSSTSSGKRGRGSDGTAIVSVNEKDVAPSAEWQLVEAAVPEEAIPRPAALPPPSAPAPRVALLDTRLLNSGALKVLRFDTPLNGLNAAALNTTALPRKTRICLLCPESHACTWLTGPASVGDILSAILDGDTRAADADVVRHTSKARRGADARVLLLECPHCGSLSSVHSPTRCPRQELMGLHLVGVTAGAAPVAVYQPTWSPPACVEALVKSTASDENTVPCTEVNALVAFIK